VWPGNDSYDAVRIDGVGSSKDNAEGVANEVSGYVSRIVSSQFGIFRAQGFRHRPYASNCKLTILEPVRVKVESEQ